MVKSYTLPVAKQVLNHLITVVRVQEIRIDPASDTISVDVTLHTSDAEETGSFSTTVTLEGADYTAIGFNKAQLVSKTRAALNL